MPARLTLTGALSAKPETVNEAFAGPTDSGANATSTVVLEPGARVLLAGVAS